MSPSIASPLKILNIETTLIPDQRKKMRIAQGGVFAIRKVAGLSFIYLLYSNFHLSKDSSNFADGVCLKKPETIWPMLVLSIIGCAEDYLAKYSDTIKASQVKREEQLKVIAEWKEKDRFKNWSDTEILKHIKKFQKW